MKNFWYRLLSALKIIVVMLLIGAATLSIVFAWGYFQHSRQPSTEVSVPTIPATEPPTDPPTEPPTEPPEPEHVISRAAIGATGDLLMHMPVIDTARQADGSYNFDYIFRYLQEYTNAADFAVANLETTLAGAA